MIPILAACGALATCTPTDGRALTPSFDAVDAERPQVALRLAPVAGGCGKVVDLDTLPDGTLLVTDQRGTVWSLGTGGKRWATVDVNHGGERGLLGLAVHPQYAENGLFYLNFTVSTDAGLVSRVEAWRADASGTTRQHLVYEVAQPFGNHNAGHLEFGPDGMLYIGWGDGGKAGDPFGHGQDRATALGAMLRVDVAQAPFAVPPDNPFVGEDGVLPEIWAYGLRNPWRYTFAPDGRMVVADVGQNAWEEVGFLARGDNAGWKIREGRSCFHAARCDAEGLREPFHVYGRALGTSITGGVVPTAGPLAGQYVFGDYVSGRLWALDLPADDGIAGPVRALGRFGIHPATFGLDADGHALVADHPSGTVYRILAPEE